MRPTDLLSFSGHLLLIAYLVGAVLALMRVPRRMHLLLLAVVCAVSMVPVDRTSLAGLSRGVLGDLSLPMQTLLLIGVLRSLRFEHPLLHHWRRDIALGMLLVETALILSALGILRFDLYGLGYHPQILLAVVLAAMVLMWRLQPAYALALLAGVVAFSAGGLASPNLWDYLFDPLLLAACLLRIFSWRPAPSHAVFKEQSVQPNQSAAAA